MANKAGLKIAPVVRLVAAAGTAAAEMQPVAPSKPSAVEADSELSRLWDEITPSLDEAGLLAPCDVVVLEMALRHFRAARSASDELHQGDATTYDEKNKREMKNPAEVVFRSQSLAFLDYAKQLGMTFVSRARTPGGKADEGGQNPFAPTGS